MSMAQFASSGLSGSSNWVTAHFSGIDAQDISACLEQAYNQAISSIMSYDLVGLVSDLQPFSKKLARLAGLRTFFDGRVANQGVNKDTILESDVEAISIANSLDIRFFESVQSLINDGYYLGRRE